MEKIYRILRNNKELGPFNLDELIQLPVKPADLVWQDGKSAAWLYPSEIELLQPYVGSSPEPASAVTQVHAEEFCATANAPAVESDELTSEKLERKAEEIYKRVQAYSSDHQVKDVEVKYARSLDDLRQDYVHWLDKKKKKKWLIPFQVKIIAGSLALLITVAVFLLQSGENSIQKEKVSGVSTVKYEPVNRPVKENKSRELPAVKKKSSVDEFIDSVRRVLAEQEKERNSTPVNYYVRKPVRTIQKKIDANTDTGVKQQVTLPPSRMVDMLARTFPADNGRNLKLVEVTIHNKSSEFLKNVSVDVFYYKKGDRLFDKETLHFNNIQPGNSYTLSLPANKKALEARFKLGTISWN